MQVLQRQPVLHTASSRSRQCSSSSSGVFNWSAKQARSPVDALLSLSPLASAQRADRQQGLPCPASKRRGVPAQAAAAFGDAADPGKEVENNSISAVLLAVAAACAGAFAFGYHIAVVNGPLEAIAADLGFAASKSMQGTVVSSTLLGAALSSLTGGGLADSLGRRKTLLLACVPMLLGPLLSAYATTFEHMVAGRFLSGVAIGLSSTVVPTYISEVAPTHLRGVLGTLNQLVICIGILSVLLVNVALPPTQWRTFFMLALAPGSLLLLGMLASPESPRWQQSVGQYASAQATARHLWGPYGSHELGGTTAQGLFEELLESPRVSPPVASTGGLVCLSFVRAVAAKVGEDAAQSRDKDQAGWLDLFGPKYRRGVLMGVVLFAIQQFAGINALVYFSTAVFKQAGVTSDTLASAAVGATNVLGTVLAASLIEGSGRKQLLVGSYIGQGVAMLVMAAGFMLPALKAYSGTLAVVGTLAYILTFALGAGPITALIISELNPGQIRGRAMAVAFTSHWVCNVALGQSFMAAVSNWGLSSVYAFFGGVALLGAVYISSQVPETKGKTFETIAKELNK